MTLADSQDLLLEEPDRRFLSPHDLRILGVDSPRHSTTKRGCPGAAEKPPLWNLKMKLKEVVQGETESLVTSFEPPDKLGLKPDIYTFSLQDPTSSLYSLSQFELGFIASSLLAIK